jgi:hypothetical protein
MERDGKAIFRDFFSQSLQRFYNMSINYILIERIKGVIIVPNSVDNK